MWITEERFPVQVEEGHPLSVEVDEVRTFTAYNHGFEEQVDVGDLGDKGWRWDPDRNTWIKRETAE